MYIKTKDESGAPVAIEVTDAIADRMDQFRHFLTTQPGLFGYGAGARYGKATARDAAEALNFAVGQLTYVETNTYERHYTKRLYEELLPGVISYAAGEGAQSVEYQISDSVGMGKRMSPSANDMPFADVAYARIAKPVAYGGIGYTYTQEDLRISAFHQTPLPAMKQKAAVNGYHNHLNVVALQGETPSGFTGLFNNASVTAANRASGAVWDAATADTIIRDVMTLVSNVQVATKNTSRPTHVAMPVASYNLMAIARATTASETALEFLTRTYAGIVFHSVDELSTLGAGTTKRVVAYSPDDDNMVLHVPMAHKFLAPQADVLRIIVPGEYKYAGLEIRRTATVQYMDGV